MPYFKMELFKGLSQEEYKILRYHIIFIGLLIEYEQDWKTYILNQINIRLCLIKFLSNKSDKEMDNIIQGILNEKNY